MLFHSRFVVICIVWIWMAVVEVGADWRYTEGGQTSSTKSEFFDEAFAIAPPQMLVRYWDTVNIPNGFVTFRTDLATSPEIIPGPNGTMSIADGGCVSTTTNERFGWMRWRRQLLAGGVSVLGNAISLVFKKAQGMAVKDREVINCPVVRPNGYKFYVSGTVDPTTFSFVIKPSTRSPTLLMKWGGQSVISVREKDIRKFGIHLTLELTADVWLVEQLSVIRAGLVTNPNATLLTQMIQQRHMNITNDAPQLLTIDVPETETISFNINSGDGTAITFIPDLAMTYKGVALTFDSPKILVVAETNIPNILLVGPQGEDGKDGLNVTEDCLRGVVPCGPFIVFNVLRALFLRSNAAIDDMKLRTFYGSPYFMTYQSTFVSQVTTPYANNDGSLRVDFTQQQSFEIWQDELVQINFPVSMIESREPPILSYPLRLRLIPSPGRGRTDFYALQEEDFWKSDIVLNFTLDGESWVQDVVRNNLLALTTVNVTSLYGWSAMKSQILPPSSITFPNITVLQIRLLQNVDFDVAQDELVTFNVDLTMFRSKKQLVSLIGNSFSIQAVPGLLLINNAATPFEVEETTLRAGNLTFTLTMAGEGWNEANLDDCYNALVAGWTSQSTLTEPSGWKNDFVRSSILGTNASALFQRVNRRTIRFRQLNTSAYDIQRQENLFINVPPLCTESGQSPRGTPTIRVLPQNAIFSIFFLSNTARVPVQMPIVRPINFGRPGMVIASPTTPAGNGSSTGNSTVPVIPNATFTGISETRMRQGVTLVIKPDLDVFDIANMGGFIRFQSTIYSQLNSLNGVEATGWKEKKRQFIPNVVNIMPYAENITIKLQSCFSFDISLDEIIYLKVTGDWMFSRRAPRNNAEFIIYTSPGLVEVPNWFGSEPGRAVITEDDIRNGLLYFNFSLLGDQWRRQREGYVLSIKAPSSVENGMATYRSSAIPDVEYFTYGYSEGREYLGLRFQSVIDYDIAVDEKVSFLWDPTAVASGLTPTVGLADGREVASFDFIVNATPGICIFSGNVNDLTERMFRRGSIRMSMTLFGETWTPQAATLIRAALQGDSNYSTGFNQLKAALVPPNSVVLATSTLVSITFGSTTEFNIEESENLMIPLAPAMFASRKLPRNVKALSVPIQPSGGELSLSLVGAPTVSSNTVSEQVVARGGITIRLRLDGDQWWKEAVLGRPIEFLEQFSCVSSIVIEPNGVSANYNAMLGLYRPNISLPDSRTVDVYLCGACITGGRYDIAADEVIQFTLSNPLFIRQTDKSALPSPSIVQFTIKVNPVPIVFVVNEGALSEANDPYYPTNRFSLNGLTSSLADFMGTRAIRVDATEDREQGVVATFAFTPPVEQGDVGPNRAVATAADASDTRPAALLASTLMALNESFVERYFHLFSHYLLEDGPPPPTTPAPTVARSSVVGTQQVDFGQWEPLIWTGVTLLFVGITVGVVACGVYARRASVGGRLRKSTKASERLRPEGHADSGRPFQLHAEDGRVIEEDDDGMPYAGQRSRRAARAGQHLDSYLQSGAQIKIRSISEIVKEKRQMEKEKRSAEDARLGLQENAQANPLLLMKAMSAGSDGGGGARKRSGVQFQGDSGRESINAGHSPQPQVNLGGPGSGIQISQLKLPPALVPRPDNPLS